MALTLKQVRDSLYKAVVPNVDSQQNIAEFNRVLNLCLNKIVNSGNWLGQYAHVGFVRPDEGYSHITLPQDYVSINAMSFEWRDENGCGGRVPVQIRNEWLDVLGIGPFLWDWSVWNNFGFWGYNSYSNDRGSGYVTFRDIPWPRYTLRIELENSSDNNSSILIKGKDGDGNDIFTPSAPTAYEGSTYQLTYPNTIPSQVYTGQLKFISMPMRQGYLKIYAVDEDTSVEVLVGQYRPSETSPSYKRYSIPGCDCNGNRPPMVIRTICKRAFVPVVMDQDTVFTDNLIALQYALESQVYGEQNDPGRMREKFADCITELNSELKSSRGGAALKLRVDASAYCMAGLYPGR